MPTTWPRPLRRAPPELPGEMAASVWIRSTSDRMPCWAEPGISRCRPEMMPAVTGVLEAEGAADRHRQLADLRQRPLKGGRLEVLAVDLDHGEVGAGIGGPDGAGDAAAVEEGDLDALHDLVPGPDHVVVGDHHAVLGPDHPAAGPLVVGDGDHGRLDLLDDLGDVAGGGLRARGEHRGGGRAGLRLLAERAPGQGRGEHGGHRQRRERRPSLSRSSGIAVVGPCGDHRSAPLWRCPS